MFKEAPPPRIQLNKRPIKQLRLSISHFQVRRVPYLPNRGSAHCVAKYMKYHIILILHRMP